MKKTYKYILIFLTLFTVSFGLNSAFASNEMPKFNYLNGDYKTFRGANFSQGENNWHDPVNANLGDVINWNVYLHNGEEGTIAHNVFVKVEFPQNETKNHKLQAIIKSDETKAFTDSATLVANQELKLDYIQGSTELWNRNGHKVKDLPDGITKEGINIGDIQGCWPYAVFIVFKTDTSITPKGHVDIFKTVRNLDTDKGFFFFFTAKTQDMLEYQVIVENNTNHRVDFKLINQLPSYVTYVQNSLIAKFNNNQVIIYDPAEELFDTYKQLHLESGKTLILTFKTNIKNTTPIGTIFINKVNLITADDFVSAEATTTIVSTSVLGKVGEVLGASTLPVTGNPITVSLALAFAAICMYYAIKEKNLFELDFRKTRILN